MQQSLSRLRGVGRQRGADLEALHPLAAVVNAYTEQLTQEKGASTMQTPCFLLQVRRRALAKALTLQSQCRLGNLSCLLMEAKQAKRILANNMHTAN